MDSSGTPILYPLLESSMIPCIEKHSCGHTKHKLDFCTRQPLNSMINLAHVRLLLLNQLWGPSAGVHCLTDCSVMLSWFCIRFFKHMACPGSQRFLKRFLSPTCNFYQTCLTPILWQYRLHREIDNDMKVRPGCLVSFFRFTAKITV